MSDFFNWTDFQGEEDQISPDLHFATQHSPELKFKHIQREYENLTEEGTSEDTATIGYGSVALFRDTMEYIEEFAIYFQSVLDTEQGFVDAVTKSNPSDVKSLLECLKDREYEGLLKENDDFEDFDGFLRYYFGYHFFLNSEEDIDSAFGSDDIIVDTKQEAVNESIEAIKQKLKRISWFFLHFDEAYNAVKHGNRISIEPISKLRIGGESHASGQVVDIDEPVAEFLCKETGDRSSGKRYIFTAPVNSLRDISFETAQSVNNIYIPFYEISHSVRKSQQLGDQESYSIDTRFFGIKKQEKSEDSFNFKTIRNPDTSLWLPENLLPDGLIDERPSIEGRVYAAFREENQEFVVETVGDDTPSYDYPIELEGMTSPSNDQMVGWESQFNFSLSISEIPLWQFKELLELSQHSPFSTVEVRNPDTGDSHKQTTDDLVPTPDVVKPEYWDLLEFAWKAGKATETELLYPVFLCNDAAEVLEDYKTENLTRSHAEDCLTELAVETQDFVCTQVKVYLADARGQSGAGFEIKKQSNIGAKPGAFIFEQKDGVIDGVSIEDSYEESFERQDPGHVDGMVIGLYAEDQEQLYEKFVDSGIDALEDLDQIQEISEANSCVTINREHGIATHWYWFDRLKIQVFSEIPSHAEERIREIY